MIKGSKKPNAKIRHLDIRLTEQEYNTISENAKLHKMDKSKYILYLVNQDNNNK